MPKELLLNRFRYSLVSQQDILLQIPNVQRVNMKRKIPFALTINSLEPLVNIPFYFSPIHYCLAKNGPLRSENVRAP